MTLGRLVDELTQAWEVPRDLLLGRYPRFVAGGALAAGEVPVFVFHGATPHDFARKLRHLADNGYQTLSVEEYVAVIRGARRPPERAVLLTFDDGRGSFWSVAAPLLRRYGMKSVVFLVPGRMRPESAGVGPTWDDVEAGRSEAASVIAREQGDGALLSWAEVEILARGGLVEFQSHTWRHARVHVAPRLAGFATPSTRLGYAAFDQPLVHDSGHDLLGGEVPLGTPLFRSAPRTSEKPRFFEDAAVRRACVERVADEGGERFFERPDWDRVLRRQMPRSRPAGRLETAEEREAAIALELHESRRRIEERTGRPVTHLCFPWHTAGPTARRLAAEAGYRTAFCGKVPGVPITPVGGDLTSIARLGEDYLELLPGSGRTTLNEILRRKWRRRFRPSR